MPIIFEVTALYRRMIKPKDYENATAEVSLKAQLEDGDNPDEVIAALLHKCRDLTVKAVGGKALGRSEAETEIVQKEVRGISDNPEDRGEALPGEDSAPDPAVVAAVEKKRIAAEKRKAKAAEKKAAAAAAETALPGEETGEGDYDPAAFSDEAESISATDLQHFISTTVSEKGITVPKAKEIMSQLGNGAGRVKDIPPEARDAVYAAIKSATAAAISAASAAADKANA